MENAVCYTHSLCNTQKQTERAQVPSNVQGSIYLFIYLLLLKLLFSPLSCAPSLDLEDTESSHCTCLLEHC